METDRLHIQGFKVILNKSARHRDQKMFTMFTQKCHSLWVADNLLLYFLSVVYTPLTLSFNHLRQMDTHPRPEAFGGLLPLEDIISLAHRGLSYNNRTLKITSDLM